MIELALRVDDKNNIYCHVNAQKCTETQLAMAICQLELTKQDFMNQMFKNSKKIRQDGGNNAKI